MRAGSLLLAAALVGLAGCSGSPDDERPAPTEILEQVVDPATAFTMDGTGCREILVLMSVPAEQARPFVPPQYELVGAVSGSATAFAALKHCDDLAVDGLSVGPASTGDAGVFVDQGEPGVFQYYQTWWATDSAALSGRLQAQGWPVVLANDSLTFTPLAQAAMAAASVESAEHGYEVAANVAFARAAGDNRAVGWFDGAAGTVTVDKLLASVQLGSGTGTLVARGTAAELYGPNAVGIALWNEYEMLGNVGLH